MGHPHKTVNELVFSRMNLSGYPSALVPGKWVSRSVLSKGYYALNNEIMAIYWIFLICQVLWYHCLWIVSESLQPSEACCFFKKGKEPLKDCHLHNVLQLVNSSVTSTEVSRDGQVKDVYSLIHTPRCKRNIAISGIFFFPLSSHKRHFWR